MKRTLYSVALVGAGVAALAAFENGDGVPQPPPREWAARNDALTRAMVFRGEAFDAESINFAADLNRGVVDTTFTSCRYKPGDVTGTTPKSSNQRLEGLFEPHAIRVGRAIAIVVVAEHQHDVERKVLALGRELRGGFALGGAPLTGIADDRELQGDRLECTRRLMVAGENLRSVRG